MTDKNLKNLRLVALTALFAALTAVATAFIKINTGINEGYLHFGDSVIYLAACVLPLPYACIAAAVGGGIADLLAGAAVWAPVTAVIKALNVLPFAVMYSAKITKSPNKIVNKATVTMPVISGLITIFGYLLAEGIMYSFPTAWTSVPFSIVQASGSAAVYWILGASLDKLNFKNRLFK